jgi:hypothetical protein
VVGEWWWVKGDAFETASRKTHLTTENTEITEPRTRRKKEMEMIEFDELNGMSSHRDMRHRFSHS